MKFLCISCDEPMKLEGTRGPEEGSLTVTFGCPHCGHRIALLTNPWETQLVRTLGVKVGGRADEAAPFEQVRSTLARQREGAFEGEAGHEAGPARAEGTVGEGPGCPFAAMVAGQEAAASDGPAWTPEAEARIERIPEFIRPMARKAIERFAQGRGYRTVTLEVMDEAKGLMGM